MRSLPTACRRRVEPLDGANPPDIHIQVDETSRDRTTRPTPRATGHENFAPTRPHLIAPHENISAIKQNQKNQTAAN